jgi:hypothetical protein
MSESEKELEPQFAAIEAALGSLAPRPSTIERDRLMFLAGRASVGASLHCEEHPDFCLSQKATVAPAGATPRRAWLWPTAAALSLLAAVAFAALWATALVAPCGRAIEKEGRLFASPHENMTGNENRLADSCYAPMSPQDAAPSSPGQLNNRQLCRLIAEHGIEALPNPAWLPGDIVPTPPRHDTYRDLLRQWLDNAS